MAEKMAERIAEILKGPNFQTAEKALTDFCGVGEMNNIWSRAREVVNTELIYN